MENEPNSDSPNPGSSSPPESSVPNSEPVTGNPTLAAELEQARAAIAQLELEREDARASAQQLVAELETRNAELSAAALDAHRRALLAEHAGQVVPELVQGSTTEEIDASIEAAKAAYTRIVESVRIAAQAELSRSSLPVVSPGNSPRGEPSPNELSPLQKIAGALSRNGR